MLSQDKIGVICAPACMLTLWLCEINVEKKIELDRKRKINVDQF